MDRHKTAISQYQLTFGDTDLTNEALQGVVRRDFPTIHVVGKAAVGITVLTGGHAHGLFVPGVSNAEGFDQIVLAPEPCVYPAIRDNPIGYSKSVSGSSIQDVVNERLLY